MIRRILSLILCAFCLTGNGYGEALAKDAGGSGWIDIEDLPSMGIEVREESSVDIGASEKPDAEWFQQAAKDYQNSEDVLAHILSILYFSEPLMDGLEDPVSLEEYIKMWEDLGYEVEIEERKELIEDIAYWRLSFSDEVYMDLYVEDGDSKLLDRIEVSIIVPQWGKDAPLKFSYDL